MANFSISDIAIKGISACVPRNEEHNSDYKHVTAEEIQKFMDVTGVKNRRIADSNTCTSDMCFAATEKLIAELNWDKAEIDILVLITQTADYILPVTAAILQDRLQLSKECIAFDIPLGCSGYVYGLSVVASLMKSSGLKRGLLLAGDTASKSVSSLDKSTAPLFGDAGTATALEFSENSLMQFNLGTDGSGYKTIIIPHSGYRNQATPESYKTEKYDKGIERNQCQLALEGMDVFSFGISQAPKTVNSLIDHFKIAIDEIDFFLFHQANLKMNKMISKKLRLPEEKVPYSLENFGNTSSATIPLTIVSEIRKEVINNKQKLLMCGFGVGLSWGTVYTETENIVCPELIEL
jgi:3-oxoacyl-[acyl-carrier-protein] synthase-3